jgi:hypothetical protein
MSAFGNTPACPSKQERPPLADLKREADAREADALLFQREVNELTSQT